MIFRRALLAGAIALVAADGAGPAARAQGAVPAATAPIAMLNDALVSGMHAGRAVPFAQRAATMLPVIQRVFDLPAILRASVGPRFASLPPGEQSDLLASFTDYTVASYVANFDHFSGERFEVSPQTRAAGADQIVRTSLVPASGDPVRLDYVMRQGQGQAGWRAVDVLVDGSISRVAVQRSDFRSLLSGGSATPLIASLRAKTQRLASGTGS